MTVYIYSLYDPIKKQIRYVGKTINLQKRYWDHIHETRKTRTKKSNWIISLKRKDVVPEIDVLETIENSNDQDWQAAECFWIEYLRFLGCELLNLESGGRAGKTHCEETRQKVGQAVRRRLAIPEELEKHRQRARIALSKPETILNLRNAQVRRFSDPRERVKASVIQKQNWSNIETRRRVAHKMKAFAGTDIGRQNRIRAGVISGIIRNKRNRLNDYEAQWVMEHIGVLSIKQMAQIFRVHPFRIEDAIARMDNFAKPTLQNDNGEITKK